MQLTAHENAKMAILLEAAANAADPTDSAVIDTQGKREALISLTAEKFAAATGVTRTLQVRESDSPASGFGDVVGAVLPSLVRSDTSVVNAQAVVVGPSSYTLAGNPNRSSRLIITLVDTNNSVTAMSLKITGTIKRPDGVSVVQEETIALAVGATPNITRTTKAFLTVTKVETPVAVVGLGGADETLSIGHDNSGLLFPRIGRLNLINRKRYLLLRYTGATPSGTTRVVGAVCLLNDKEGPVLQTVGTADYNLEF